MDIVLDTNILRSDFLFRSKDFEILKDYLVKTESNFIIPEVVLQEIKGLYKRTLNERITEFNINVKNLNLIISDTSLHYDSSSLNIEKETEKYMPFLKETLKLTKKKIIP